MSDRRRQISVLAARIWDGTADSEGRGLLVRGDEYQPKQRADFDPLVVDAIVRLARLADRIADGLHDCPDQRARLAAAFLAARSHPIRAAFDD